MSEPKAEYRTDSGSLMLKEISVHIGVDTNTLSRYLSESDLREYFEPSGFPAKYPRSSLPKFERLGELIKAKAATPKRALSLLTQPIMTQTREPNSKANANSVKVADSNSTDADTRANSNLTGDSNSVLEAILAQLIISSDRTADTLERLSQRAIEAQLTVEDRFISKEEAAQLLNCKPENVSNRVRCVERGSWSFLEVQEYMRQKRESNLSRRLNRGKSRIEFESRVE